MDLLSLETTAELLGRTTRTVKTMVKQGDLIAVYPRMGKNGRPSMMITTSSYGQLLLNRKAGKRYENTGNTENTERA